MKIKSLHFRNFKGIVKFDLPLNGESISILGANGTGKTTIKDGVTFLLFDKGSDFESLNPKTLNPDGSPVHGLEHEIKGVFMLESGQEVTLKKIFKEKWAKPRGQAKKIITGHTTEHYIDDMSLSIAKGKYQTAIKQIATEETFRLLTSPDYFPSVMKWEARRKLLMEVCGDVPDDEVIKSSEELQDLVSILSGRKLDDHKKVVAGQRKKINDQIEHIPARIDEVQRAMPDTHKIDIKAEKADSVRTLGEIEKISVGIASVESRSVIHGLKTEEETARVALSEAIREFQQEIDKHITEATNYHGTIFDRVSIKKWEVSETELDIKDKQRELENTESDIAKQSQLKEAIELRQYVEPPKCPKCGYLFQDDWETLKDFNLKKSQDLEDVSEQIDDLVSYKNILKRRISLNTGKAYTFRIDLEKLNEKEVAALSALGALKEKRDGDFPGKQKLVTDLVAIITRINTVTAEGPSEELAKLQTEKTRLEIILEVSQELIKMVEDAEKSEARINELKDEERMLAGKLEELERQLFLMDQFERAKVDMLEEKINSKFEHARFKLFHEQMNEGLRPMCEVVYQGVPYNAGLNNGARIHVGLDIIKTLQEHFNFTAPVFIDNAESVHSLPEMDCQVIRLVVDETKPEMEVC